MSDAAGRELKSWGEALVNISRGEPARCDLLLQLRRVSAGDGPPARVSLYFDRRSRWHVDDVTHTELASHEVVLHRGDGDVTRIARLVLPKGLEDALHIGQDSTRELDLETLANPLSRSHKPRLSRRRPRHVVVWAEFAVRSRLSLWWACASFPSARVWVVPIPRNRSAQEEVCTLRDARELMTSAPGIRKLTAKQVARFASNWKSWQRGDARIQPVDLSDWPGAAQWVGDVPQPIFELFPRVGEVTTLAPYDSEILELLGSEWSTSMDALWKIVRTGDDRLMQMWGDNAIHARIHAWSQWQRGRFVEHQPSRSNNPRFKFEYRITDEGRALLNEMPSLEAAPPMRFGGFTFYTPGSWVITSRGPQRVRR